MPSSSPQPYKSFLTPSLHRRFTKAAALLLAVCYIESIVIGPKNSWIWSWFPIGIAGIRTLLVFLSAFSIFVLRVAQLHVQTYNAKSSVAAALRIIFSSQIPYTASIYIFSAWFFGEIYLWSAPISSDLGWTVRTKTYNVPRLNERPIFIRMFLLVLALSQTMIHTVNDMSLISMPLNTQLASQSTQEELRPALPGPAISRVRSQLLEIITTALAASFIIPLYATPIYYLFARRVAWRSHMWIAQTFVSSELRPTLLPHEWAPPAFLSVILRCIAASFILLVNWRIGNALFTAFIKLEPLKSGQPLTSDSKDPNGSLILGLRSKKEIPQAFAIWELSFISASFPDRRISIYSDLDRATGPSWSQILDIVLPSITSLAAPPTPVSRPPPPVIESLPRLTSPVISPPVISPTSTPNSFSAWVSTAARDAGSPGLSGATDDATNKSATSPPLSLLASIFVFLETTWANLVAHSMAQIFTASPFGGFAKQVPRRVAASDLLGSSALAPRIYAITSLSALTVHSLKEDDLGRVQNDVKRLIQSYLDALNRVISLVLATDASLPPPRPAKRRVTQPSTSRSRGMGKAPEMRMAGQREWRGRGKSSGSSETGAVGSGVSSQTGYLRGGARPDGNGKSSRNGLGSDPADTDDISDKLPIDDRSVEGLWVIRALCHGLGSMLRAFDQYLPDVGVGSAMQKEAWEAIRIGERLAWALDGTETVEC